jgi:hypothetical protein
MIPVETVPRIGGRGKREQWWMGEFKYDVFDTL